MRGIYNDMNLECIFFGGTYGSLDDKSTAAKVKIFEIHCTLSLVALADEFDSIYIWNFEEKILIKQFNSGSATSKSLNIPSVKCIKWLDSDTLLWKHRYLVRNLDANASRLVVQSDVSISIINIVTEEICCFPMEHMKLKDSRLLFSCVEVITESILMLGSNDGCVRLFNWKEGTILQCVKIFRDKVSLTHLICTTATNYQQIHHCSQVCPQVVVRGEDGQLAQACTSQFDFSLDDQPWKVRIIERHKDEKEITCLSYTQTFNALVAGTFRKRAGSNNEAFLNIWNLNDSNENFIPLKTRIKIPRASAGQSLTCLDFKCCSPPLLLFCSKDPVINVAELLKTNIGTQKSEQINICAHDASSLVYTFSKSIKLSSIVANLPDRLKFYQISCHPTKSHLTFISTNVGIFVIKVSICRYPNFVCRYSSLGPIVYYLSGGETKSKYLNLVAKVLGGSIESTSVEKRSGNELEEKSNNNSSEVFETASSTSDKLLIDPTGRFVARVSISDYRYQVYASNNLILTELERGDCVDIAFVTGIACLCLLVDHEKDNVHDGTQVILLKKFNGIRFEIHHLVPFAPDKILLQIIGGGTLLFINYYECTRRSSQISSQSQAADLYAEETRNIVHFTLLFDLVQQKEYQTECLNLGSVDSATWSSDNEFCAVVRKGANMIILQNVDGKVEVIYELQLSECDYLQSVAWVEHCVVSASSNFIYLIDTNQQSPSKCILARSGPIARCVPMLTSTSKHSVNNLLLPHWRPQGNLYFVCCCNDNFYFVNDGLLLTYPQPNFVSYYHQSTQSSEHSEQKKSGESSKITEIDVEFENVAIAVNDRNMRILSVSNLPYALQKKVLAIDYLRTEQNRQQLATELENAFNEITINHLVRHVEAGKHLITAEQRLHN